MNPSPRVSACRSGRQHSMVGKGVVSVLQGRVSGARWAAGQAKSSVQQGRSSVGWCQGRPGWPGAALWCVELSCCSSGLEPAPVVPWKWWSPPFCVFSIKVLAPLMPSAEFAQEPISGWSRWADMATLNMCPDLLSGSPCQVCLLWLR